MPDEPQRCYLLIKEKADGTQPRRLEEETEQPTGQQTKKVGEWNHVVGHTWAECIVSMLRGESMCVL